MQTEFKLKCFGANNPKIVLSRNHRKNARQEAVHILHMYTSGAINQQHKKNERAEQEYKNSREPDLRRIEESHCWVQWVVQRTQALERERELGTV